MFKKWAKNNSIVKKALEKQAPSKNSGVDKIIVKSKHNNAKKYLCADGVTVADSKLEGRMFDMFYVKGMMGREENPVIFQKKFDLIPGFKDPNGKAVTHITYTCDFFMKDHLGKWLIIDAKGRLTEPTILRLKLLEYKLMTEGIPYTLCLPRNPDEVQICVQRIEHKMPLDGRYKKGY